MRKRAIDSSPSARLATAGLLALLALAPDTRAGDPGFIFSDGFENVPISAPFDTWTFVPFDDAFCGNNTTTGIGINPHDQAARVLLFLTGGGACWDQLTCLVLNTAQNFNTGYGPTQFAGDLNQISTGFFDRASATNPFRDYSFVYVPYCTGDIHGGNNVMNYGGTMRRHVGHANLGAFLERLVPTFRNANRVILAGASAGGFGAALNWQRVQQAFGNIRVDMIDDSGTFMPASIVDPMSSAEVARRTSWNLAATLPAGCTACSMGLANIYTHNATSLPNSRGALLSFRPDTTIATFYQISTTSFSNGLNQNLAVHFDPFANRKYFVIGSSGHVLFANPALTSNGVTLETFLTRMLNDDPMWSNVLPP